ncbi:MAG: hypothetical protein ACE5R4_02480 [Armatimonadota bacterium]
MARYAEGTPTYFDLKADLSPFDADILERLVERRDPTLDVVRLLVRERRMSQTEAFAHIRGLLLSSMARLHRGHMKH